MQKKIINMAMGIGIPIIIIYIFEHYYFQFSQKGLTFIGFIGFIFWVLLSIIFVPIYIKFNNYKFDFITLIVAVSFCVLVYYM